ncbi:MAG: HK97 family phage prohead protease [Roseburia sp.]|nr:HK97 family phage prohead protease [Roseburia sp.]
MKEVRNTTYEIRAIEPESRTVSGYAIVFNTESTGISGFTEVISPTALEGVLERSDVLCLLNHNEDKGVLARSNKGTGSLTLEIDERGLKYSFDAPNTALGDELIEGLKRGDITTSSFAFTVADGGDAWTKREDGTYLRTINSFDMIFDVSPVYRAAYDATSVKVDSRGLDAIKASERAELENYFNELRAKLK